MSFRPNYCPKCRNPLTYVEYYEEWYCKSCQEYRAGSPPSDTTKPTAIQTGRLYQQPPRPMAYTPPPKKGNGAVIAVVVIVILAIAGALFYVMVVGFGSSSFVGTVYEESPEDMIVGTWYLTEIRYDNGTTLSISDLYDIYGYDFDFRMSFYSDGSGSSYMPGESTSFVWHISGNQLYYDGKSMYYTLTDYRLTLDVEYDQTWVFEKS